MCRYETHPRPGERGKKIQCTRHIPTNLALGGKNCKEPEKVGNKQGMFKGIEMDLFLARNDADVDNAHGSWDQTGP